MEDLWYVSAMQSPNTRAWVASLVHASLTTSSTPIQVALVQLCLVYYAAAILLHYIVPSIKRVRNIQARPPAPGQVRREALQSLGECGCVWVVHNTCCCAFIWDGFWAHTRRCCLRGCIIAACTCPPDTPPHTHTPTYTHNRAPCCQGSNMDHSRTHTRF